MRTAVLTWHESDVEAKADQAACGYPGCRSAVSPHHSPHLIEAPYIEQVRREARADAGHRIEGDHDCFLMDCKRLGREVEMLRATNAELNMNRLAASI